MDDATADLAEAFGYVSRGMPNVSRFEVNQAKSGDTLEPSVVFLITLDDGQEARITFSPDKAIELAQVILIYSARARASHFE